ncbi:hypothetical protein [Pseudarthrobacter sp. N5]|uniref:hypothetical protein n=1 Tax=Pseudarthrobacter sp. N5 TaxID=3418416 RepID=UPI003CF6CB81
MGLSRRLLFASALWEVARPRTALTAGHLLIRLSNPATAFDHRSAADWLLCHNAARQALVEVLGVRSLTMVFAHQWHPLGAAIGEPEAESSTPTFHLFGRWDGESIAPGAQLRLPAQRRLPVPPEDLRKYDGGLRRELRRAADAALTPTPDTPAPDTPAQDTAAPDTASRSALFPGVRSGAPGNPAGPHHMVLTPERRIGAISEVMPLELLALAAAIQNLAGQPSVRGLSCVVPDSGAKGGAEGGGRLEVHALGRSAGEDLNPLEFLLRSPEINAALL